MKEARVIAYYLPQFHPIKENDEWWGKGFTEWTNVGKAKPLFKGHYQPRVPADLGYYDLRMPEVREAQAELAREAGIEGFMYWHYSFGNGKRVLERPFNEVLASRKPDFPFCLGWANHSWTNQAWDDSFQWNKEQNLIEQTYPKNFNEIENYFNSVLPAFQDDRYITVDSKPIFLIYDPFSIPNPKLFMDTWRNLAAKNGLSGIHFVGLSSGWLSNNEKIINMGFDAVNTNGQWNAETITRGKIKKILLHKLNKRFNWTSLDKYSYKEISNNLFSEFDKSEIAYPTIIPQWDRTARSGNKASIYVGSTPELFGNQVKQVIDIIKHKEQEKKIVFVKSWNEWAEGNYLEPDIRFGHEYLDQLRFNIMK